MLQLHFTSQDSNNFEQKLATFGYENCWQAHGQQIIEKLETLTGLEFQQSEIEVIVIPGSENDSGMTGKPMKLAADYHTDDEKLACITHELAHRLLGGNKIWVDPDHKDAKYQEHCRINLFLYDLWCDLKGEDFAKAAMERELEDAEHYEAAWNWALGMNRQQRDQELQKIIRRS